MFKRTTVMLLIVILLFSFSSCKSVEDEENAAAGEVVQSGTGNSDSQNTQNQTPDGGSDSGNNAPSDNGNNKNPDSDTGKPPEDDTRPAPDLSTSGDFTVTFDYGYDSKIDTEKTSSKATEIKAERKGYKFLGWFDGQNKWDFSANVTADKTLTAKWEIITYKITYVADGAVLPDGNPTSYTVEDTIELKPATKTYLEWLGWQYTSTDKGTTTINVLPKGTAGDIEFKPSFNDNRYVIGTYEQDGDNSNGKEPITWIKVREENGKAFLMSEYILDAKPYQSPKKETNWSACSLRTFLNGVFYKNAFSADEKNFILKEKILTPRNSQTNVGSDVYTDDYVIVLSIEEVEGWTSYAQRPAKVTEYAKAQGCVASNKGSGDWWMRTVGCYTNYGALVQQNGATRENGYSCDMTTIGVRPAICIDVSKLG